MNSPLREYLNRVGGGSPAFRLCLVLLTWASALVGTVPQSTIGNLLKDSQFMGWLMLGVASVGVVEIIINDFFPERYRWPFALRWRHMTLMLCAGFFLMLVFLITQSAISWLVIPYFLIFAFFIAWNAFMDVWRRCGPGRD